MKSPIEDSIETKEYVRPAPSIDVFTIKCAKAILLAMKIREESYNKEAAKLETEDYRRKALRSEFPYMYCPDYSKFYELTLCESCKLACEQTGISKELAQPIDLGMHWWNGMYGWAIEVLGIKESNEDNC